MEKIKKPAPIILIYGTTASGKTEFAEKLKEMLSLANKSIIINMDSGQMFHPFGVGTAKPENLSKNHFLFSYIENQMSPSAGKYRLDVENILHTIDDTTIPIVVGGTGFYLYSLFFKIKDDSSSKQALMVCDPKGSWQDLAAIDPKRAQEIHPHDTYRITRALEIYYRTGLLPSTQAPQFEPVCQKRAYYILIVERDSHDLLQRVSQRTKIMLKHGWVEETERLLADGWGDFLKRKQFIGYPEIIAMLEKSQIIDPRLIDTIIRSTMHYAKRQKTFWNGFEKKIKPYLNGIPVISLNSVNLTFVPLDLYLNQFIIKIRDNYESGKK